MILDDLFAAAADFDTDRLATLMHPDVRFDEMPNLIAPHGNAYGFDAALAGFRKGRETLSAQSYDIHSHARGRRHDRRAGRHGAARWRRRARQLTAHIATFTQVRDGRIFRHATYDCYEALPG